LVDVFRLRPDDAISYHEFQNVDVVTGSQRALHKLLDPVVIPQCPGAFPVTGNVAGLERIPSHQENHLAAWCRNPAWHRRKFNLENEQDRNKGSGSAFAWLSGVKCCSLFPENLQLVFVSKYFAEEVFEDLGFRVRKTATLLFIIRLIPISFPISQSRLNSASAFFHSPLCLPNLCQRFECRGYLAVG
jgi:hypothetical protein